MGWGVKIWKLVDGRPKNAPAVRGRGGKQGEAGREEQALWNYFIQAGHTSLPSAYHDAAPLVLLNGNKLNALTRLNNLLSPSCHVRKHNFNFPIKFY